MIVLTILAWSVGAVVALAALARFERHALRRYGHQFFTRGSFLTAAVAAGCIASGWHWWLASRADGGDLLNGVMLIAIGTCAAAALVARNLRRTGIVMGTCGSFLQVSVFALIGYFGLLALAIGFLLLLLVGRGVRPVWVVNR